VATLNWWQPSGSFHGINHFCAVRRHEEPPMRTLADHVYFDSSFDTLSELPSAGSPLENPYVYDSIARELKEMAARGLLKIVDERRSDDSQGGLISKLTFQRLQ
jgi:hypothetical protein